MLFRHGVAQLLPSPCAAHQEMSIQAIRASLPEPAAHSAARKMRCIRTVNRIIVMAITKVASRASCICIWSRGEVLEIAGEKNGGTDA